MKCQFYFLSHVDDGGLQMRSEKFFIIYSHELKMFLAFMLMSLKCFFQVFVPKGDTGQFYGEITAYEQ